MISSLASTSVGSGLILLIIVGAWLAVLVPMALRSHEASSALGTVDKFHDAMRVLSRRDGVARAARRASGSAASADALDPASDDLAPADPSAPLQRAEERVRRPGASAAARRRRVLGGLTALALVTLPGAVLGPVWLVVLHGVADVLLGAYVVWLRRQAVARAAEQRAWHPRTQAADAGETTAGRLSPRHVDGIPDRMPSRSLLDGRHRTVPATPRDGAALVPRARTEAAVPAGGAADVPAARGAQGEPWQPVPVPVPTYVTAPRAPRAPAHATRAQSLAEAEHSLGIAGVESGLERRRAVGD